MIGDKKCPWCGDPLPDHPCDVNGFLICPINDNDDSAMRDSPYGTTYDDLGYSAGTCEDEF